MQDLYLDIKACIYCGEQSQSLTREHIMPRGLGGNEAPNGYSNALVLQNASCKRCQQITSKIERDCLLTMMGSARAKLGLRRKDRASTTTEAIIDLFDGTSEDCELNWNQVPGVLGIPSFYEAGIFTNKPLLDVAPCDYKFIIVASATEGVHEKVRRVGLSFSVNSKVFAQMLAKIALGIAVARFGLDGFEPLVQNFILNEPDEYGYWVGGFAGSGQEELKTTEFHKVHLIADTGPPNHFIVVEIRLFAEFSGPTNYVVVGRRNIS